VCEEEEGRQQQRERAIFEVLKSVWTADRFIGYMKGIIGIPQGTTVPAVDSK